VKLLLDGCRLLCCGIGGYWRNVGSSVVDSRVDEWTVAKRRLVY
jgi:hypothetical protein